MVASHTVGLSPSFSSTTDASVYSPTSTAIPVGSLAFLAAALPASVAPLPTINTGRAGYSYNLLSSVTKSVGLDTLYLYVLNKFVENPPGTPLAIGTTLSTSDPATGALIGVSHIAGLGKAGAESIRQIAFAGEQAGGISPRTVFASPTKPENMILTWLFHSTSNTVPSQPVGFTRASGVAITTPTAGFSYAFRTTGAPLTTVQWASSTLGISAQISIELDTAPLAGYGPIPM